MSSSMLFPLDADSYDGIDPTPVGPSANSSIAVIIQDDNPQSSLDQCAPHVDVPKDNNLS